MNELAAIIVALCKNPEGIRCCVAEPPYQYPQFSRGTTGVLSHVEGLVFRFSADGKKAPYVNFVWSRWQGLHIPSLNIIRP